MDSSRGLMLYVKNFYTFLLCLPTVLLTPVDQQNKVVSSLSGEAKDCLKPMQSNFDNLLDEFIKSICPVEQNGPEFQAALKKPDIKEKVDKFKASDFWRAPFSFSFWRRNH
ncbi:hypothetical protein Trydic_g23278 [Trypoxylus dichotomus]